MISSSMCQGCLPSLAIPTTEQLWRSLKNVLKWWQSAGTFLIQRLSPNLSWQSSSMWLRLQFFQVTDLSRTSLLKRLHNEFHEPQTLNANEIRLFLGCYVSLAPSGWLPPSSPTASGLVYHDHWNVFQLVKAQFLSLLLTNHSTSHVGNLGLIRTCPPRPRTDQD